MTNASPLFPECQSRKKSAAIDFARPEGAELVRKIAKNCDVVVENFKVGASRNSASMPKHCAPRSRG